MNNENTTPTLDENQTSRAERRAKLRRHPRSGRRLPQRFPDRKDYMSYSYAHGHKKCGNARSRGVQVQLAGRMMLEAG